RYLGGDRAERAMAEWAAERGARFDPQAPADVHAVRHTERLLASAIGAPSARLVTALALERRDVSPEAAMRLLDDATAALQYNRELLQSALENVRQGICVFDRELRLVCWNSRFADLLELPPELCRVGVALQDIVRFNAERGEYGPGDIDELVARRLESFLGPGETVSERARPNGTVLELRVNPMPDGGCVATYSDITERVRAAAALAAANEQLEQRVAERTAALTALNAELSAAKTAAEQANIGKTRFLAAASHDLLQPLNAARLYVSSLIERQADPAAGTAERELVAKIDASLTSVEELLGALLDISRLDAGALTPQLRRFPLGELLDALKVEFAPLAERKGLDLRIVPTSLVVESDRRLLHRLLQNLLSNAIRYTRRGKVLMGARRAGPAALIQVWDTGSGIPEERQALVFKEFQRFTPGPGMEHGLGLGLSIVDRIGRMLDHPVTLRSEPGRGTVFSVRVPRRAVADAAPRAEGAAARIVPALDGAAVLCVDNEPRVLDGMRTLLEGWGCRVLLGTDAEAAWAAVRGGGPRPALLIVDYHLHPGEDGIACIRRLRGVLGDVAAVLITADRSERVAADARREGLPVLNKPVKPATLRALMMRLLATRQAAE
ncbi:MAG: PAS-domain containing protein, partial [Rhodospirillaceae bacterium]|nr:PAS-domain containing protein [Rhodospirillaceae bacterium]